MSYHEPVMAKECIELLEIKPNGVYVDCTFGGGGHSLLILQKLNQEGRLIAFDQDPEAWQNQPDDTRLIPVKQNFKFLKNNLLFLKHHPVDGIFADLGVSSHQFDTAERGFSTRFDGELDMRMNNHQNLSAKQVINEYAEEQLADIFYYFGELRNARKIAKIIVHERKTVPITHTQQLKDILKKLVPAKIENKIYAQVFQAVRIEVNAELEALKSMLLQSAESLHKDGRLVVLSYHSLEDRLVKHFIKFGKFEGEPERDVYGNWEAPFKPLQSKVLKPSEEEINNNSRARSAKLRVGIKN